MRFIYLPAFWYAMDGIVIGADVLSVICQLGAVYLGYRIYGYNRLTKGWLALVIAFAIQAIRRAFTVSDDLAISSFTGEQMLDRVLMFFISVLILVGLWAMLQRFESFEIAEKKVKAALKGLNR